LYDDLRRAKRDYEDIQKKYSQYQRDQ